MRASPQFSVVMPLFNKAKTVARAIQSVLTQDFRDFELIVVDDGSTDSGAEIVRGHSDPRIHLVSQENAGVSSARNRGIESASAELIAFIDADDEWDAKFLGTILELARKFPECSVFATSYCIAKAQIRTRRAILRGLPPDFREGILQNYFEVASQSDPPLWSSAIAMRAAAIRAIDGFPVGIATGEDLLTWARLAVANKIAYSTDPLATFWEPDCAAARPGRIPAVPDRVGDGLQRIIDDYAPDVPAGMVAYLARWHQMRGAIFLQLANSQDARAEIKRAMRLIGPSVKLLALYLISMLPGPGAQFFYRAIRDFSIRRAPSV